MDIVILAAGKGTRMRSTKPKVLQQIAGKSMLCHLLDTCSTLPGTAQHPILVLGYGRDQVASEVAGRELILVEQPEQLGTGHAVQQALPHLSDTGVTLILYGDVPLISADTLSALLLSAGDEALGLLTVVLGNPTGYGRILRDDGRITQIVEEKDASAEQKAITEINTGIMAVPNSALKRWLGQLNNDNAQGEYYLTDIIAMASAEGIVINACQPSLGWEVEGVNNRVQQAKLERLYQRHLADTFMSQGLALADPERFDCRGQLHFGEDVFIDINVIIEGEVSLGDGVTIGPNCVIKNSHIGAGSRIEANSVLEAAHVEEQCSVGPYARLRPGTHLQKTARVGNFVEVKKSVIGVGSKVNHLSYIGDCDMGKGVNIGAGTITCNYDGVNKFRTEIGDDCFVGSNTALVAPVALASGTTVAAGSTITRSTGEHELAIARGKQRNIAGWQRPVKQ